MRSYDLVQDYYNRGQSESTIASPDVISVNAHWVLAVIRLKFPMTYRRSERGSFSKTFSETVETRGKTLIISSDCIQLQTSSTKSNHLTQMSATLAPGETNYLAEVLPGDYLVAWIVNDEERSKSLISRIRDGQPCNKFMDGLKFFGKVHSLQKTLNQEANGTRHVRYNLSGVGFSEFDATLFYDPHLAEKIDAIGRYMGRISSNLNDLTSAGMVDVNKAIPFFVELLLGRGVSTNLGRGNDDIRLKSTAGLEGAYAYILPTSVGALIGKTVSSKEPGILAASDLLELLMGVQQYGDQKPLSDDELALLGGDSSGLVFWPNSGETMMGRFLPNPPQFTNSSVWSILSQYLNPACNEMFTVLRSNGEGNIVPTLVVRQLPFSTHLLDTKFPITQFLDLPRWKIHPILVRQVQVGRSDTLRFNFVNVQGLAPLKGSRSQTAQLVANPPFRDDLDIARSGLRNYSATIPCALEDINIHNEGAETTQSSNWMDLLADILMGQHLTLTGSMTIVGVQAPICPGDNLEWDGVVFHIESVAHATAIQQDGKKSFTTTLTLSHGVRSNPPAVDEDISIYAGIKTQDQMSYNPPVTDGGQDHGNLSEEPPGTADIVVKLHKDQNLADENLVSNLVDKS